MYIYVIYTQITDCLVTCLTKHSKSNRVALWGLCALSRLVPDPVIRTRLAANGIVETVLKVLNRQGGAVDVVSIIVVTTNY